MTCQFCPKPATHTDKHDRKLCEACAVKYGQGIKRLPVMKNDDAVIDFFAKIFGVKK